MLHVHDLITMLHPDEKLSYYGKQRQIKLSAHNLVHLSLASGVEKILTFGRFREDVYFYSEQMNKPCVTLLSMIAADAEINARKGRKANDNYLR